MSGSGITFTNAGYNLSVGDHLQAVGVELAADGGIELVKPVDGPRRSHVPEDTIVEQQLVRRIEGGTVSSVVARQRLLEQSQSPATCLDVVHLQ